MRDQQLRIHHIGEALALRIATQRAFKQLGRGKAHNHHGNGLGNAELLRQDIGDGRQHFVACCAGACAQHATTTHTATNGRAQRIQRNVAAAAPAQHATQDAAQRIIGRWRLGLLLAAAKNAAQNIVDGVLRLLRRLPLLGLLLPAAQECCPKYR